MEGEGTDTVHTDSRCLGQHWTTTAGSRKNYLEVKGWKTNSMDNTHKMSVLLASGSRLTAALLISLQGWSTEYLFKNKPLETVILKYHFSHLPLCKSHRHRCPLNFLAGGKTASGRSCGCSAPLIKIRRGTGNQTMLALKILQQQDTGAQSPEFSFSQCLYIHQFKFLKIK